MKKLFIMMIVLLCLLTGCQKKEKKTADDYDLDYLVLVNKLNPLPEDWEIRSGPST